MSKIESSDDSDHVSTRDDPDEKSDRMKKGGMMNECSHKASHEDSRVCYRSTE